MEFTSISPRSTFKTPSNSLKNGPSTTSLAVVIIKVSGSLRGPIDEVKTFFRSAPFFPAVSRACAYSSIITRLANKPSCVFAFAVKHLIKLSLPGSLKVIFSLFTRKCLSLGSRPRKIARISSKQILACS